jgi:type VI secretion system secreted protein VgrG
MSTDVFSFQCDALDGARLAGFKGVEVLNRPFEIDVFFTVPTGTDVRSAVGARASLVADRDDGRGPVLWHGVLAAVRLLHETAERALYRALLVPRVWLLSHHVRSFVHTRKDIQTFAADTLKHGGLVPSDFSFHTGAGEYPQEEFVCQYRESHLDFLHRWFEREGLYYYFEHAEGGGAEKMVIVDDKAHHHPLLGDGAVRYVPSAGADTSAGECLRELHADFRLLPAGVLISDYNYANPSAPVAGRKTVSGAGLGVIHEYGYRVFTEGEAARLAGIKAQSIACRELVLTATGDALGLRAGYTFKVLDAPADLPVSYLAVEVRHAGVVAGSAPLVRRYTGLDQAETYRVDVVAIPSDVQFRAAQSTAWPRIYGFENGTVDGTADSQYAQLDEQGRYLVRFKFDTSGLPDGSTSTYLRMMQPHGGSTEGWHFPLRKGTEVMVSFQGGDPDRPVIAGVVPNALTPSNVTSKNHTQNVLRTGGGSYIVMDDMEDQQYIDGFVKVANTGFHMGRPTTWVAQVPPADPSAPRDDEEDLGPTYAVATDGDAAFKVGGSWWQGVGGNYWLMVKGVGRVRIGGDYTFSTTGNTMELFHGSRKTRITTGYLQEVFGGYRQEVEPGGSQTVTGDWMHKVTGESHDDYGSWKTDVGRTWTAKVGGDISITSTGGAVTITSHGPLTLDAPLVKQTAPAKWYKATSHSAETYLTKNSAEVEKADACAVSISITGLKRDVVGSARSLTGVKTDVTGLHVSIVSAKVTNNPTDVSKTDIKTAVGAIESRVKGLLKLG